VFSFILCKAPTRELHEGFRIGLLSHSCSISLLHLRTLLGLLDSISSSLLEGRPSSSPNRYHCFTMLSNWHIRDLIPIGNSRSVTKTRVTVTTTFFSQDHAPSCQARQHEALKERSILMVFVHMLVLVMLGNFVMLRNVDYT